MTNQRWATIKTTTWYVLWALVVVVCLTIGIGGCTNHHTQPGDSPVSKQSAAPTVTPGAVALAHAGTIPPYNRKYFRGDEWAHVKPGPAGPKCTVRGLVLYNNAVSTTHNPLDTDHDGCADDGPFRDLYTGQVVNPVTDDEQVDEAFSLRDAWFQGAWQWTPEQRWMFHNDQSNLIPTTAEINGGQKREKGPDQWEPPTRDGKCAYAHVYEGTAKRWHLTVTPPRRVALDRLLTNCAT